MASHDTSTLPTCIAEEFVPQKEQTLGYHHPFVPGRHGVLPLEDRGLNYIRHSMPATKRMQRSTAASAAMLQCCNAYLPPNLGKTSPRLLRLLHADPLRACTLKVFLCGC